MALPLDFTNSSALSQGANTNIGGLNIGSSGSYYNENQALALLAGSGNNLGAPDSYASSAVQLSPSTLMTMAIGISVVIFAVYFLRR